MKRSQECSFRSPEETVSTVAGMNTSGDFGTMEDRNDIALLKEELIQLAVKSSLVVPSENPTLIPSLLQSVERNKIRLVYPPFWIKVSPCPPECDKDLMHAVGSTFKGIIRSEIKDEVECSKIPSGDHVKADDDYPFSLELKAESSILEKESLLFVSLMKNQ
ncbi:hypothetical protein Golob_003695 [Gossypium lobatum]|uniref:Uncharacterized protein n=1 Tax=Gossypium lobatum TaxID=34289 RepID=A0A7J8MZC3_9ROSI|nr:hypothetical protein [Gossypium lobatum]